MQIIENLFILISSNVSLPPCSFSHLLSKVVVANMTKPYMTIFISPGSWQGKETGEERSGIRKAKFMR